MKNLFSLIFLFTLLLILSQCLSLKPTLGVQQDCDLLIFDNEHRFNEIYDSLEVIVDSLNDNNNLAENLDLIPLILFESSNKFESYRKFVFDHDNNINNDPNLDDIDNELDTIFEDDDVIKTLLNLDRMVMVGDSIRFYYDDCTVFYSKIRGKKCDAVKIEQLLLLKEALDNQDTIKAVKIINDSDITFVNECELSFRSSSSCISNADIIKVDLDCTQETITFSLEVIDDFSTSGFLPKREWQVFEISPSDNSLNWSYPINGSNNTINVSVDNTVSFRTFRVEIKYSRLFGCSETFSKVVHVSCGNCFPPDIAWSPVLNAGTNEIEFTVTDFPQGAFIARMQIDFGDGQSELLNIRNGDTFRHQYLCVRDYRIVYSFVLEDINGLPICNIPMNEGRIFQIVRPQLCCSSKKQKLKDFELFDNGGRQIRYKLKHKKKKIIVVAKHFRLNSKGKFKRRRTNWAIDLNGPLVLGDIDGCECEDIAPFQVGITRNDRKKAKFNLKITNGHFLRRNFEWSARIDPNGWANTYNIIANCNN